MSIAEAALRRIERSMMVLLFGSQYILSQLGRALPLKERWTAAKY